MSFWKASNVSSTQQSRVSSFWQLDKRESARIFLFSHSFFKQPLIYAVNQFKSGHRRLTDEARKLSIIAFNNNPMDETIDNLFTSATTPCQFSNSNVCSMMKGRMGITAHASDNISLIVASILDAIQDVMDLDLLLEPLCGFENPCIVEKVEFWEIQWRTSLQPSMGH